MKAAQATNTRNNLKAANADPNMHCVCAPSRPDPIQPTRAWLVPPFARLRHALCRRKGFGTLEVVIIIAVILSIALLFRKTLSAYAANLINTVFAGDPLAN